MFEVLINLIEVNFFSFKYKYPILWIRHLDDCSCPFEEHLWELIMSIIHAIGATCQLTDKILSDGPLRDTFELNC